MQVIVFEDEEILFCYDNENENMIKVPDASSDILIVRSDMKEALEFLDASTGRKGKTEVNEE